MSKNNEKSLKIKVCTGSYCADHKGNKVARRIKEYIEELGAEDHVTVKKCDCIGRCKKGPIVEAPSRRLVFEGVKPGDTKKIVKDILKSEE